MRADKNLYGSGRYQVILKSMNLTDKFFALFKRDAILFCTALLTGIVIARQLGPDLMGAWTILLLIPGYAEAAGRSQYDASAVYFICRKKADLREITYILHLTAVASTVLVGSIFFFNFEWFYSQLFSNIEKNLRVFAAVIFVVFPLRLIFLNYSYLLIAQEDIKNYNILVIIQAVVTAVLSILLIMALDFEIAGAVAGSLAGVFFAILYAAILAPRHPGIPLIFNRKLFLEMGKYASNHYLSTIISYFQNNITSLISALFMGPSQVAFYALGKSMCDVSTRMVPAAINTALFPHVSRLGDDLESALLAARLFRVTLLILMGGAFVLAAAITPIVDFLYGPAYSPMVTPFFIMIPGVVLSQAATIFSTFFSGMGRPDLLPKASIFPLILQVLLSINLIPSNGVTGAAISFSASTAFLFVFQVSFFLKLSKISFYSLIPRKDDILSISVGIVGQLVRYRDKITHSF